MTYLDKLPDVDWSQDIVTVECWYVDDHDFRIKTVDGKIIPFDDLTPPIHYTISKYHYKYDYYVNGVNVHSVTYFTPPKGLGLILIPKNLLEKLYYKLKLFIRGC